MCGFTFYFNVNYSPRPYYSGYGLSSGPVTIVICLVKIVMHLVLFFLNFIFCCLKLPCIRIYKHTLLQIKYPCFTQHLGPLRPSFH